MLERLKINWVEKVTAVIITLLLMYYVESITNPIVKKVMTVPLQTVDMPYDGEVRGVNKTITVQASGEKEKVEALQPAQIHAYVSLKGLDVGRWDVPVKFRPAEDLESITLTALPPKESVEISRVVTRSFRVELETVGALPEGFEALGVPSISPRNIQITAWEDIIKDIQRVKVTLNLSNIQGETDLLLPISAYDKSGRVVPTTQYKLSEDNARVKLSLAPIPNSKRVVVDVPFIGKTPIGIHIEDITFTPQQIELEGDSAVLMTTNIIKTEPIDLTNITASKTIKAKLLVPKGLRILGSSTISVKITIIKQPTQPETQKTPEND